ncbi:hypothetical protein [Actinospica robiniae]|uniref:hypothetical protein n=1 Tax=Actinospica robiniae TaxID=304901 RepID=UPI000412AE7B|nr:hypothetical protein [Actinospica robiniae]
MLGDGHVRFGGRAGETGWWEHQRRAPVRPYDDIHQAFLALGCAIICWRRLRNAR